MWFHSTIYGWLIVRQFQAISSPCFRACYGELFPINPQIPRKIQNLLCPEWRLPYLRHVSEAAQLSFTLQNACFWAVVGQVSAEPEA